MEFFLLEVRHPTKSTSYLYNYERLCHLQHIREWNPIDLVKGQSSWRQSEEHLFSISELWSWTITEDQVLCFFYLVRFCLSCHQNCPNRSSAAIIWFLKLETCVFFYSDKWSIIPHDWLNTQGLLTTLGQTFLITSPSCQWYSPPSLSLMNLQYSRAWAANQSKARWLMQKFLCTCCSSIPG